MRADYEHAIAVLIGKPPAQLTLARNPVTVAGPALPGIPGVFPSQLLNGVRHCIGRARMAAANEQIGIGKWLRSIPHFRSLRRGFTENADLLSTDGSVC